jgi:hypothetical protein
VQCPGTSVPLNGSVTPVPGALSVVISAPLAGYLDEVSWTLTNSFGTVIGSGGSYSGLTTGDTYTIPIGSSANGPYSLFVETQGPFNDNIANYSVICNGSTIISGTVNAGQTTAQSLGQLAVGGAQAQAAGQVGAANAYGGAAQNIGNAFYLNQLLKPTPSTIAASSMGPPTSAGTPNTGTLV